MKDYKQLTITDNFMFTKVMSDERLLKGLLERIIPGLDTAHISIVIKEHTIDEFFDTHGIRFDVYAEDDTHMFGVEMQMTKKNFSVKRTRYYQSTADMAQLSKGSEYDELKKQYVIFIFPFDPFDDNLFVYTYTNRCHETGKDLDDGTAKIFINCSAENKDEYPGLKPFGEYVMGRISDDAYISELDDSVRLARMNPMWRKEYMDLQEIRRIERKEGREEGREEGMMKERLKSVRALCDNGFEFSDACRMLKLTEEEIEGLKKAAGSED